MLAAANERLPDSATGSSAARPEGQTGRDPWRATKAGPSHGAELVSQFAPRAGALLGQYVAELASQSAKRFDLARRQVLGNAEVAGRLSATTVTSKLLARIP